MIKIVQFEEDAVRAVSPKEFVISLVGDSTRRVLALVWIGAIDLFGSHKLKWDAIRFCSN